MARKVWIFFMDGATFNVLDRFLERDDCPEIKKYFEKGVSGNLKSVFPPNTLPALPCFYTGLNPGKIGLRDFIKEDGSLVSSYDVKFPRIWDMLNKAGYTTAVLNVPSTFPAQALDGVMITGALTPRKESNFIYPPEAKEKYSDWPVALDFEFRAQYSALDNAGILKEACAATLKRMEIWDRVMDDENPDFSFFFVKGTDVLQHFFWGEWDLLLNYYKSFFKKLNELEAKHKPDNIIFAADHGFEKRPTYRFNTNAWLKSNGYLKIKKELLYSTIFPLVKKFGFIKKLAKKAVQGKKEKLMENH